MNPKTIFFQPKYVKKFICDGSKCGAQCCGKWIIDIDKHTFEDYAKIESPAKEITSAIKYFDERKSYVILLDENYFCPLLTEDKLCSIQKKYGAEYLSTTCQSYPRSVSRIADFYERALSLSCPLVAELVLLQKEPLDFEVVEETPKNGTKFYIKSVQFPPEILPHVVDIQVTAISILQERTLTLNQRLAVLGFFLDRLTKIIDEKNFDEIPKLTETYSSSKFISQVIPTLQAKLNFLPKEFVKFMFGGVLEHLYGKDAPFKDVDEIIWDAVIETYKLTPDIDGTISVDDTAENFIALNELRGKFLTRFNTIFENYLVNEFFMTLQPFRLPKSFQRNFGVYLTMYKIIELFTFALSQKFPATNEYNLINLISVMASSFDHTPPYLEKISAELEGRDTALEIISTFLQI